MESIIAALAFVLLVGMLVVQSVFLYKMYNRPQPPPVTPSTRTVYVPQYFPPPIPPRQSTPTTAPAPAPTPVEIKILPPAPAVPTAPTIPTTTGPKIHDDTRDGTCDGTRDIHGTDYGTCDIYGADYGTRCDDQRDPFIVTTTQTHPGTA